MDCVEVMLVLVSYYFGIKDKLFEEVVVWWVKVLFDDCLNCLVKLEMLMVEFIVDVFMVFFFECVSCVD